MPERRSGEACDITARLSSTEPWELTLLNSSQLLTWGSARCCTCESCRCNWAALPGANSSRVSEYGCNPRKRSCGMLGLSAAPTMMSVSCLAISGLACPPPPSVFPVLALLVGPPGLLVPCRPLECPEFCGATCPRKFIAKYQV